VIDVQEQLALNFPECLAADFPDDLPGARAAFEAIAAAIVGADFSPLARRSPALAGFDWPGYLRCSIARMVHAAAALRRRGIVSGRMLDYGSYFGNFALMFARAGFSVDAVDSYRAYQPAFDRVMHLLADAGVRLLDFADAGYALTGTDAAYDVVLCVGVIEHPARRGRCSNAQSRARRRRRLVLDTPNLVHLYNRQKFARGGRARRHRRAMRNRTRSKAITANTRSGWSGCCGASATSGSRSRRSTTARMRSAHSRRATSTITGTWSAIDDARV
jgi:hypothetical protein